MDLSDELKKTPVIIEECERANELPPYDEALHTERWCIAGLIASYILSISLIILGIVSFKKADLLHLAWSYDQIWIFASINAAAREIIVLIFNSIVTAVAEWLGYIHGTSLRWALYHEDRLCYNSNLRLFTSARHSVPNSWYINLLWAILLTLAYSCATQTLLSATSDNTVGFNSLAIVLLGCCLFGLSLLATWCLLPSYRRQIISWNSDPLNTTLALLHKTWSVPALQPVGYATPIQPSIQFMQPKSRVTLTYLWCMVPLICGIGAGVVARSGYGLDMSFVSQDDRGTIELGINTDIGVSYDSQGWLQDSPQNSSILTVVNILVLAAIQILYTLALHIVEQLVNQHRDEAAWRRSSLLGPKGGAIVGRDSSTAAFTSWQTVFLLVLKPVSHWLFGLCIFVDLERRIQVHPLPCFTVGGVAAMLAIFATYLAFQRPEGPQPVTYGNLRMLAAMIDDWGEGAGGKLYWGDKGCILDGVNSIRLAGTSLQRANISPMKLDNVLYKSLGDTVWEPQQKHSYRFWLPLFKRRSSEQLHTQWTTPSSPASQDSSDTTLWKKWRTPSSPASQHSLDTLSWKKSATSSSLKSQAFLDTITPWKQ
jgi:uncharacterized membrane protein YqjE